MNVPAGERRNGREPGSLPLQPSSAGALPRRGSGGRLRAARRRVDARHEPAVTAWLRRLERESGPSHR